VSLTNKRMTKLVWEAIATARIGNNHVRRVMLQ
jgi:hypothetical protein